MNFSTPFSRLAAPVLDSPAGFRLLAGRRLFVFNYHEVSDRPSPFAEQFSLSVSPGLFRQQIEWIRSNFIVIDAATLISGEFSLPAALVTFDDGSASVFRTAGPILKELRVPATVFINMASVMGEICQSGLLCFLYFHCQEFRDYMASSGRRGVAARSFLECHPKDVAAFLRETAHQAEIIEAARAYSSEWPLMDEVAESAENGLTLGNHLFRHFNAAVLEAAELTREYRLNEDALQPFQNHVPLFSYPFGQPKSAYNRTTDALILGLGARRIFTAFSLFNSDPDELKIHRTSMFEFVRTERTFRAHCVVSSLVNHIARPWMAAV